MRSKRGSIWTKAKTNYEWWEVELVFRVNGRGRLGADGLALWFTSNRNPEGPVFGSADNWHGLAIFFDSFDNDNKGNNPYIMAMVNDGTKSYDHQADGSHQQLGGCLRDFRNKPFPTRARIEYYKNVLQVRITVIFILNFLLNSLKFLNLKKSLSGNLLSKYFKANFLF